MRHLILWIVALSTISCGSIATADPVDELRAENTRLRQALAFATMQQAQKLAEFAHEYEQEHEQFPERPSELRRVVEQAGLHPTRYFLAPYDAAFDQVDWPENNQDRLWELIDEHSSFVFHGGELGDDPQDKVLMSEKTPIWEGHPVQAFQDGHASIQGPQEEAP